MRFVHLSLGSEKTPSAKADGVFMAWKGIQQSDERHAKAFLIHSHTQGKKIL